MNQVSDQNNKDLESRTERYIQFGLGNENYAVPLLSVKEVIPVPETTSLPNSPAFYIGIMNLRGQIISIVDLRKKLSIAPRKEDLEEAVLIVEIEGVGIGLIVDSINRVLNISMGEVSEVPEVSSQVNAKFIEGVYQSEDHLTILLDLSSILNIKDIKKLNQSAA